MFADCTGSFGNWLGTIAPRFLATFTFLPCGLLMGYTLGSVAIDRIVLNDFLYYGPLVLGCFTALIMAIAFVATKYWRNKVLFFHFEIIAATCCINIIASILFFIDNMDIYGSYIAFIAYGMTFITTLTYLNIIASKDNRTIILSICFAWYLFGIASAISLIGGPAKSADSKSSTSIVRLNSESSNNSEASTIYNELNDTSYDKDIVEVFDVNATMKDIHGVAEELESTIDKSGLYQGFAGLYLTATILSILILVLVKIYNYLGNLDYKKCLDHEVFIANSNETIFDSKEEVLKELDFFYVTKSKQWLVSFILLFCDSIHFSFFIYITSWFLYNPAIKLTSEFDNIGVMYWIIFAGSILGLIALLFVSIKMIFVTSTLLQIFLLFLGMIIRKTSLVPLWIVCFLYGMNISNIKVLVLETSHLKLSELMIFISCTTKLFAIGVINVSFMRVEDSMFYIEGSALIAHSLAFVTISALITIIVTIKVPRTYKNSLFEIQNSLLGVINKKHQIEKLNMKYLRDGTIPTISQNVDDPKA